MRSVLLVIGCVACGGITTSDPDPGAGAGGGGGTGAVDPIETCSEAELVWKEALIVARDCDPLAGDHECTQLVRAEWACGCKTYVNSTNAAALSELKALKQTLDKAGPKGCKKECVGHCVDPLYAVCQTIGLGGSMGHCSDVYY